MSALSRFTNLPFVKVSLCRCVGSSVRRTPPAYIHEVAASHNVVLFVDRSESNPNFKQCNEAIELLNENKVNFKCVNIKDGCVLEDTLKRFSGYTSTPQLFVKGNFVGGYDQLRSLLKDGRLQVCKQCEAMQCSGAQVSKLKRNGFDQDSTKSQSKYILTDASSTHIHRPQL